MKKLLATLAAALFALVAVAYWLGYANASDFFIDFYMALRKMLGVFSIALPILCLGLAAVVLVFGWRRAYNVPASAWPAQNEAPPAAPPAPAPPPAGGGTDWLFQPLAESSDQFNRYFAEELMAGPENAGQKRKKKFYARFGENFNTYFGEGSPSFSPVSRTVRVHGFQRYFSDAEDRTSQEQSREGAGKKRSPQAWGTVISVQRPQEQQPPSPPSSAPPPWRDTPPPLSRIISETQPSPPQTAENPPSAPALEPPGFSAQPQQPQQPPRPSEQQQQSQRPQPQPQSPRPPEQQPPQPQRPQQQSQSPLLRPVPVPAAPEPEPVIPPAQAPSPPAGPAETGGPRGRGMNVNLIPDGYVRDGGVKRESDAPAAGGAGRGIWAPSAASYVPERYSGPTRAVMRRKWYLPGSLLLDKPTVRETPPAIVPPERLEQIFAGYNVGVSVNHVTVGPVVTRYEVVPCSGTKIRKIESLADDVALALASSGGVRIEMIPGRGALGVEVPNKTADTVYFRQIVQSARFNEKKSLLRVALGKDIANAPVVAELNKMPHLLVAGATGSGKSIFINCLINSILFSATPDEARLMLIDPKMVELSQYSGIPHLLAPVVTDAKKATAALRFLVREMEWRYELFASRKVRDIGGYNASLPPNEARLPYVVVIIDEMADLMMAAANDIEELVCRLAQMARAAGMHLVLATQRPSVNVITGLIKANIPTRVSFAVSSQIDSRTIIDAPGAEKLLGRGDMLYLPVGLSRPMRVHGCYISEAEIRRVADHWLAQGQPLYQIGEDELTEEALADKGQNGAKENQGDEKFFEAGQLVVSTGVASTSFLQRRMKVGYARAARLMDLLEEEGVVGASEGNKPREIRMNMERFLELFSNSR